MKSVIIYTYFQSSSSDYNLSFFVKTELSYKDNIDYIIVINGHNVDSNIHLPEIDNLTVIRRDNVGYDFGGHNCALEHIKTTGKLYDYFFFMNSGVIGPIIPHYFTQMHWTNVFINKINDRVKLVGTTIVCLNPNDLGGYGPKVEGFFFMTDIIGLELLLSEKTIFCDHADKRNAILDGEYGLSKCILKNGYTIDCMLPRYQNVDWTDPNNYNLNRNLHPSRKNAYFGKSIQPYDVIFHKWHWHNEDNVNRELIEQYVEDVNNNNIKI
jgi:hypothetical protein